MTNKYVVPMWITLMANDLEDATSLAHLVAITLETEWPTNEFVTETFIGEEYEIVINEFGDTVPAEYED